MHSVAVFQAEEGKRSLPKGAHVRFDVETRGIQSKCNFAQDIFSGIIFFSSFYKTNVKFLNVFHSFFKKQFLYIFLSKFLKTQDSVVL
jgi:hypothetical protein